MIIELVASIETTTELGEIFGLVDCGRFKDSFEQEFSSTKNSEKVINFLYGYFNRKYEDSTNKKLWLEQFSLNVGKTENLVLLLSRFNSTYIIWKFIENLSPKLQELYWQSQKSYHCTNPKFRYGIRRLLKHNQQKIAQNWLSVNAKKLDCNDVKLIVSSLIPLKTTDTNYDGYTVKILIQKLKESGGSDNDIFLCEWIYYDLIKLHMQKNEFLIHQKLLEDATQFHFLFTIVYKSTLGTPPPSISNTKTASRAWNILKDLKKVPGTKSEQLNFQAFLDWFEILKNLCETSGHTDAMYSEIGRLLRYSPSDGNLWIDGNIAQFIEQTENEYLLIGMRQEFYNSRGIHWVDPSGNKELEIATDYKQKADDLTIRSFTKFAKMIYSLAADYKSEATYVKEKHQVN